MCSELSAKHGLTLGRTNSYPKRGTRSGGRGGDGTPLEFLICCSISKRFYLQWKAFDLLYKMRYILWVLALLEGHDVTNIDHRNHLGFYQRLNPREMVTIFVLEMKNNTYVSTLHEFSLNIYFYC